MSEKCFGIFRKKGFIGGVKPMKWMGIYPSEAWANRSKAPYQKTLQDEGSDVKLSVKRVNCWGSRRGEAIG